MNKNLKDFTIGADPELLMLSGNKIIVAEDVINPDNMEFGCDGNGILFEVRPIPSSSPINVVKSIHSIFQRNIENKKEYLGYRWLSGSYHSGYGIGGHVHFGTRRMIDPATATDYLDNYLGAISVLIEDTKEGISRRKTGYGRKGDYRPQNHGFEYRTCSSWITSPYVALAILSLSKTVMYEVINNPKFKWNQYIFAEDVASMSVNKIKRKFPELWRDITKMHLYQEYKPYIDILYFLITNKLTWYPTSGMKESWGLIDNSEFVNKFKPGNIDLNTIWQRYNATLKLERPARERNIIAQQVVAPRRNPPENYRVDFLDNN